MRFAKLHGLGNDFIVVDRSQASELDGDRARRLCDRRFGIGGDGVLLVEPGAAAPWRMTVFNADGSRPEMCGNGLRCVVRHLHDRHGAPARFEVETDAGVLPVSIGPAGVTVQMGRALHQAAPRIELDGRRFDGDLLSLGNPHFVMFGDWDDATFHRFGQRLSTHPRFPDGANVSFAHLAGDGAIDLKVWERGAGPTLACGTGACATAADAWLSGRMTPGRPIEVRLPGGALTIDGSPEALVMTGPAEHVFDGVWVEGRPPSAAR